MFIPTTEKEKNDWKMALRIADEMEMLEEPGREACTLFHYAAFQLAQTLGGDAVRHFDAASFAGKGLIAVKALMAKRGDHDNA